jgi:hypothetical protein
MENEATQQTRRETISSCISKRSATVG